MRPLLFILVGLLLGVAASAAAEARALFNGRDLEGWEFAGTPAADIATLCTVHADQAIAVAGRPVGFIATKRSHANCRLHGEWRWPGKPGNSGLLLHISSGPRDRAWPLSFQVQTKHQAAGDLLPMAGAVFAEPLTSPPGVAPALKAHLAPDSEKPAGEWNTCDVTCRGDRIGVVTNGVRKNSVTGCSLQVGKIGFQFGGAPFEFRHLSVVALD